MLRANCEDLGSQVHVVGGESEAVALRNHRNGDFRLVRREIQVHASLRSQAKREECGSVVVCSFGDPFGKSLRLERMRVIAPNSRVMVYLQGRYVDSDVRRKNEISQCDLPFDFPDDAGNRRV